KLIKQGSIDAEYAKTLEKDFRSTLQDRLEAAKTVEEISDERPMFAGAWKGLRPARQSDIGKPVPTKITKTLFLELAKEMNTLPKDKKFFRKITKVYEDRLKMIETDKYDWAMGELMAYATLLNEDYRARISGQDVQRGTFSHR